MSSIGFRVFEIVERPDRSLVEAFGRLPVANISDNMNRLFAFDPSLRPVNRMPLLGTAVTVRVPSGDNLMINYALELAKPGDVLVIGHGNDDVAFIGSLMARKARNKGLGGIVVDGCVRDLAELQAMDFPVYCRGVSPRGPYKNGPGEINAPIAVGGQVVFPGDIIVGDGDGLIAVRPGDAPELLPEVAAQNEKENKLAQRLDGERVYIGISADFRNRIAADALCIPTTWDGKTEENQNE